MAENRDKELSDSPQRSILLAFSSHSSNSLSLAHFEYNLCTNNEREIPKDTDWR